MNIRIPSRFLERVLTLQSQQPLATRHAVAVAALQRGLAALEVEMLPPQEPAVEASLEDVRGLCL